MIYLRCVRDYLEIFDNKESSSFNLKLIISILISAWFFSYFQVLQDMLEQIDRQQRNKLRLDNISMSSPERHRLLRHQYSSDNMNAPPFNIPNLRIDQRKTSSAENMARKNSGGQFSKLYCISYRLYYNYIDYDII